MPSKYPEKGVAFFPSLSKMGENPYWNILAGELEKCGVFVEKQNPNTFDAKWLKSNRHKIDVLHIHFYQLFYKNRNDEVVLSKLILFLLNLIYARILGYRVVYTVHNLDPNYWVSPRYLDKLGHIIIILLSNCLIVHCEEARKLVTKKYLRRSSVFVFPHPNYIDWYENKITKEKARARLGYSEEGLFVYSFIGGIRPNKGIENLIRAFRMLKESNFRLLIAGAINKPASYAQYLQALAGADKRIAFHFSHIQDDELQIYLNASDVIVLPFVEILTSGSANLALSFGRPVIAPRLGCLPSLIEPDAGWIYSPGDIDALSQTMKNATTQDLRSLNISAKIKVETFTSKDFGDETLKVYGIEG